MRLKTIIMLSLLGGLLGGGIGASDSNLDIVRSAAVGFLCPLLVLLLIKVITWCVRRSCNKAQIYLSAVFLPLIAYLIVYSVWSGPPPRSREHFSVPLFLCLSLTFIFEFMLFSSSNAVKPKKVKESFPRSVKLNAEPDCAGEDSKQDVISGDQSMECPRCRLLNHPPATRCDCGYDFSVGLIQKSCATRNKTVSQEQQLQAVQYGGFWRRVFAYILDGMIVTVGYGIFMLIFWGMLRPELVSALLIPIIVIRLTVLRWFYFAWFESSRHQATIGKQIFGLMVQTEDARTLSFARATGRYFSKLISALPLLAGFIAVGLHHKKQGYHDLIAKTIVVHRVPDNNRLRHLPPWLLALIISILSILDAGFVNLSNPNYMVQCSLSQRFIATIIGATLVYGWVVFLLVITVKISRNRKRECLASEASS